MAQQLETPQIDYGLPVSEQPEGPHAREVIDVLLPGVVEKVARDKPPTDAARAATALYLLMRADDLRARTDHPTGPPCDKNGCVISWATAGELRDTAIQLAATGPCPHCNGGPYGACACRARCLPNAHTDDCPGRQITTEKLARAAADGARAEIARVAAWLQTQADGAGSESQRDWIRRAAENILRGGHHGDVMQSQPAEPAEPAQPAEPAEPAQP